VQDNFSASLTLFNAESRSPSWNKGRIEKQIIAPVFQFPFLSLVDAVPESLLPLALAFLNHITVAHILLYCSTI
jgi:hypothetical protein